MSHYIGESLSTRHMLTLVRFLASMSSIMNCKSAPLNEALSTPRVYADVRPFFDVDAIMPLEVRLAAEALRNHVSEQSVLYKYLYLIAGLPTTLKRFRIQLTLYQFYDVHPTIPLNSLFTSADRIS